MTIQQAVPPTEAPVSLAELKGHLISGATSEDADLQQKLDAAIAWMSGELERPLITSTWDLSLERWPCASDYSNTRADMYYWLRRGHIPLLCNTQSITFVRYTDSAGVTHTVDPTGYKLSRYYDPTTGGDSDCGPGRLYAAYGQSWPTATLDVGEPITIRLVAGWADASSVPVPIKQAILMLAAHWAKNREAVIDGRGDVSVEIALGVQRLISTYADRRF